MLIRAFILSLCLLRSSALPAPENLSPGDGIPGGNARTAGVIPAPGEPLHGRLPELNKDETKKAIRLAERGMTGEELPKYLIFAGQASNVTELDTGVISLDWDCPDGGIGTACSWSGVPIVIRIALLVEQIDTLNGSLGTISAVDGWHVANINTPDEIRLMENHLSLMLSTEVYHVGIWYGEGQRTVPLSTRSVDSTTATPRHIFAGDFQGHPVHFTYMGQVNNNTHFRFGYGLGPIIAENRRRMNRRETLTINNQYFDKGGFDYAGVAPGAAAYLNPDNQDDFFNWVSEQVSCYFEEIDDFPLAPALQFQIYNSLDKMTLAANVIAPFTKDSESAIGSVEPTGGIIINDKCAYRYEDPHGCEACEDEEYEDEELQ
ncbi:hypothetical protein MGYG_01630 [Nannizzia gypsea CBS 118893]|uniref:Uncharacterized protein n=1 Tax=Arthroderma gypseum (strain ATCC MYA-4604 / CBS 118893) TaxID=535722 RepID=E5R242_ARTGP|nr:hypothetical protein MGYG_01630 [Nannizzia gypsea CBS 118893]EFQ98606.1 hypothetical protein MGYG_01630 [Nannizzia gypsea CBS 118893]